MRNDDDAYSYRGSGKCHRCDQPIDFFRAMWWDPLAKRPQFRWLILDGGKLKKHWESCSGLKKNQAARNQPANVGGNESVREG